MITFKKNPFTPDNIKTLSPDEVFVFGSNLAGHHGAGAARAAINKFGAIYGQGVGLQGQSYAIPTMQGGVETITPYVDEFIDFAKEHPEKFFYVTRTRLLKQSEKWLDMKNIGRKGIEYHFKRGF